MNKNALKQFKKERRARRTRARVNGTADRPRLRVTRSLTKISCQLIDDVAGKTIGFADDRNATGTKTEKALAVGKAIAEIAAKNNITTIVFDRGSYVYHGRVKALAEGAREGGLIF